MDSEGERAGPFSVPKKQQDRKALLLEYLKNKDKKQVSTPTTQPTRNDKHSHSSHSYTTSHSSHHPLVTPVSRPQPPPAPHKSGHKYDQVSKTLFHEKENVHENKRRDIPTSTVYNPENDKSLPMEERLRRWREKKPQKAPATSVGNKPRPNPSSFTSTSTLFDPPRALARPAPARPALTERAKPSHAQEPNKHTREHQHQRATSQTREEDGNDTGNEGGDESDQYTVPEPVREGEQVEEREEQEREREIEERETEEGERGQEEVVGEEKEAEGEIEGDGEEEVMDMSALLSPGDEDLLKGLGNRQQRFQKLYEKIEERLRQIQEGILSADSVRSWITELKPKYTGMTQFYVLWAIFEERLMMFDNAGAVYDLGLQEKAEPQYELLKEYRAFLDRKAQSDINRFNKTVEALSSSLAQSKLLHSPPRSALTQPTSTRKSAHKTPSKRFLALSSDDPSLREPPSSPYRDTTNQYRDTKRDKKEEKEKKEEEREKEKMADSYEDCTGMDLNESLVDNFQHMGILTPRVYKSTPTRPATTPPHTPPSIPNEISDFSPVSPDTPPRSSQPITPRAGLMTPRRAINMEAILRDSLKKVLSHYDSATPAKTPSYVVLEKVALSKEEREALGAEFAVTPVRKFGERPKSTNRNMLDEVDFVYTPAKTLSFKDEEEPEDPKTDGKTGATTEIKAEMKMEDYEVSHYTTDAELADDEKREEVHSDTAAKSTTKKTPKNRKRSRSALPLVSPALGTFESLEIIRKPNTDTDEAISLVATPHRSARKAANATPANTPKRKKVRLDVEPEEADDSGEDTIAVTNVRRSKRLSVATPIKLPAYEKPLKVIFTPNYHCSSNITDANKLAQFIDMTHQDYYVSSD